MNTNRNRQTLEVLALVLLFLGITILTVVGFVSRDWLPTPASEHAAGVDEVIRYLLITTGAILVIGHVALVAFLWRYGRGQATGSPQTSARAERWWSLLPVIGMALIAEVGVLVKGLPVWNKVYGPVPADALVVEVTAKQFEWISRYPGKDATFGRTDPTLIRGQENRAGLDKEDPHAVDDLVFRNVLHVPEGRTIHVRLRSRDVLHSFSVPAFRIKQDVVPGIVGRAMFVPIRPGRYEIGCAELCGLGHYRMRGAVVVHSPEEYEQWLQDQVGWLE